jgi:1-deoxy-D-xylulose-5-phosphate synthase
MLYTAYQHKGPAAVRYPRGSATGVTPDPQMTAIPLGKGRVIRSGTDIAILAFGTMLHNATAAAEALNATLVDMRFVKPLDLTLLQQLSSNHQYFITIEDNAIAGGAGSGVNEAVAALQLPVKLLNLGLPDQFIRHGTQEQLYAELQLDQAGIEKSIRHYCQR